MSKELREEFSTVRAQALAVAAAAVAAKRGLTAEEKTENDRRFARCDEIKGILAEQKRFDDAGLDQYSDALSAAAALAGAGGNPATRRTPAANADADSADNRFDARTGKLTSAFKNAANQFIRTGSMREEFALTSTGNAVLLPTIPTQPTVIRRLNNAFLAALLSRGQQPLYTAGTETVAVPVFDDTSNNGTNQTSESATTETEADPSTASSFSLGAVLFDSKSIWLSNTLLNGVPYDVLGYVEPILQKRIDLNQDAVWTAKVQAAAVAASIAVTTTTHAAGVTYQDLLNWQTAIPAAYRSDQVFIISDTLFTAMRGLVDSLGRPLYQESLIDGEPDKLFGKPAFISPSLATVAANAYTGITMSAEAIKVRLCTNRRLTRYVNIPTHPDQFGMQMFVNGDFNFVGVGTAMLKQGAS